MDEINKIIGQNYKPFNYYGSATATKVIVAMGSVCETIKETVDYLTKACNLNHSKACYNLAVRYNNADGVEKNPSRAALLYEKSCDLGYPKSCYNLGIMYIEDEDLEKNNIKALELFTKACGMNLKEACEAYDNLKGLVY